MPHSGMRFLPGEIVRNEGHGIFWRMSVSVPEPVRFVPGQFAMVSGWPGTDPLLPRPLAIFRSEPLPGGRGTVEFVYKVVGRGTALLSGLHRGAPLALTLPLGRGFPAVGGGGRCWLVGGGVGFSSVFPAAESLAAAGVPFELFLGAKTRGELPPREWTPGAGSAGRVHVATEDGTFGYHGRVSEFVDERLGRLSAEDASRLTLLACGPVEMLKAVALPAGKAGAAVHVAMENRMACGFGVCWGCVIAVREGDQPVYRRVCREGPVFDAREVVW